MGVRGIGVRSTRKTGTIDCFFPGCTMAVYNVTKGKVGRHTRYCHHHLRYLAEDEETHRSEVPQKIAAYQALRENEGESALAAVCDDILKTQSPPLYLLDALFQNFKKVEAKDKK